MYDLDIVPMKRKAGVLVRGDNGPNNLFQEVKTVLSDFYSSIDMFFVAEHIKINDVFAEIVFNPGRTRYSHKVYSDLPEFRTENWKLPNGTTIERNFPVSGAPFHGYINMKHGKELNLGEIVLEWDFPQGRAILESDVFAVYFDLKDKNARERERDKFVGYVMSK